MPRSKRAISPVNYANLDDANSNTTSSASSGRGRKKQKESKPVSKGRSLRGRGRATTQNEEKLSKNTKQNDLENDPFDNSITNSPNINELTKINENNSNDNSIEFGLNSFTNDELKSIVIQPGSKYLRIGFSNQTIPFYIPNVIGFKVKQPILTNFDDNFYNK
eukprot:TRINITY_DN2473_c0_g1_i1.p1 TRINITY_DN2473_c0_g1~~TRINITY_DN2473_c0_g1_i1.p1  ORF type:complete len:163 (+),score=63.38 TRINITY_DN2473_c0_g1_i1:23-511(+)